MASSCHTTASELTGMPRDILFLWNPVVRCKIPALGSLLTTIQGKPRASDTIMTLTP